MNIEHLKLFVRLSVTHNISQAGNELGLSPAVASSYISKLEDSLGVRLVHRTTRKVSLTEEGMVFLPHAEELLAGIDAARAAVGVGNSSPKGTLRVTAPASFGRMHLMPALRGFMKEYPDLSIDLRMTDSIVDLVEGGFDIAIRNAELKDSSLIARKLAADRRIVCASPDYIRQYGEPLTPDDLKDHKIVNLAGIETWSFKSENGPINIKTKDCFKSDHGEAVRDACANGFGVALSATWIAYEHLSDGRMVEILKDYPLTSDAAIWAVYPSSRLVPPKVRVFIDYLSDYFGSPPYWDKALESK